MAPQTTTSPITSSNMGLYIYNIFFSSRFTTIKKSRSSMILIISLRYGNNITYVNRGIVSFPYNKIKVRKIKTKNQSVA